jgi:benzoate-CoA ligase
VPEIEKVRSQAPFLKHVLVVGGGAPPFEDFKTRLDAADTTFAPAPTTADDAAFWLYSGRNPERLMAAVHHHSHMVYCSRAYAEGILNMNETDRVMGSFLFFAYGLGNGAYFPFFKGGTSILFSHPPKPEHVYSDLAKYRPTLFFTVPTLLGALADYKKTCREKGEPLPPVEGLRACISSAEILSPEIYRRFKEEFGVEILDGTGSTEICHIFLSSRFDAIRPGSTGKIVPGYEARLIDDDGNPVSPGTTGNLRIRGGSIASAYWNQREETKRNMQGEWFVTGDRYMMDEDGFFFFRGRSDDMLRVGGKWLSPLEVEKAVDSHPAVIESAVVGLTDKDGLVKPYAFVVLSSGTSPSEALKTRIQAHVKERIAAYKYPRWIEFIDAIPKTRGGKIRRYALQEKIRKKDTPC